MPGDVLAGASPSFQQELYQALDLQAVYDKAGHQVSLSATITDTTPLAVTAIIAAAGNTAEADFSDLFPLYDGFGSQIMETRSMPVVQV
jgi:hypothetical protein